MFADVSPDREAAAPADRHERAERLAERLCELSHDLRAVALFEGGTLLAATGPGEWEGRAAELWAAAEEADPAAEQVHIGTTAGEVFGLRSGELSAVAVCARFALASLMFCDLRAALRDLVAGEG
jgi:hypothetical protein